MAGIAIAAIGAAIAAGTAGEQASQAHEAGVKATHAENDQQRAVGAAQDQITQQNKAAEAQKAGAIALTRQRAVAALSGGGNFSGTLGTGAQGASPATTQPGQKQLLGL